MASLLEPGSYRASGITDDAALVAAMLRVEVAWVQALAECGAATSQDVKVIESAALAVDASLRPEEVEAAGNPVLPMLARLRGAVTQASTAAMVHRGLTSQDVLDTALMLIARNTLCRLIDDLDRIASSLAALADRHRGAVMAGRTLTQFAVPVSFGLRAAHWLVGVDDARESLRTVNALLPVQCGGAAGTLALAGDVVGDAIRAARVLAERLELVWPGLPWHTRRTPITGLGDALTTTCDALGRIAGDVMVLGRPEVGEVREAPAKGRGTSSTMPHKQNPVLGVLVRSAALQAPQLSAQLHAAAAQAVDERPPGEWHAEWPALRRLLDLTLTAASQCADIVEGLEVNTEAMRRRAQAAAAQLLSEREAGTDPSAYLGSTQAFIDEASKRWQMHRG